MWTRESWQRAQGLAVCRAGYQISASSGGTVAADPRALCATSARGTHLPAPRHFRIYNDHWCPTPSSSSSLTTTFIPSDINGLQTTRLATAQNKMISNSFPEYIFIRICIIALRAIAPLSLIYTVASWYEGRLLHSRWLGLYALAEACFYLLVYLPRSFLLQKVSRVGLRGMQLTPHRWLLRPMS